MDYFKKIVWSCALGLLTAPVFVLAAQGEKGTPSDGGGETELRGPIDAENVAEVLEKIIDTLLIILTPVAVVMAIYAGFLYLTAGGREERVKQAHHTLLYVVVGIAVLILSRGFVNLVMSILK